MSEYFGTKGCIIQLSRSRNNSKTMRRIKDMVLMLEKASGDKLDQQVEYLSKLISEKRKENKIDSFEEKWLNRLLESETINKSIELLEICPNNPLDALEVYNSVNNK